MTEVTRERLQELREIAPRAWRHSDSLADLLTLLDFRLWEPTSREAGEIIEQSRFSLEMHKWYRPNSPDVEVPRDYVERVLAFISHLSQPRTEGEPWPALRKLLHAAFHVADDCEENAQTGAVTYLGGADGTNDLKELGEALYELGIEDGHEDVDTFLAHLSQPRTEGGLPKDLRNGRCACEWHGDRLHVMCLAHLQAAREFISAEECVRCP